ncbi:oligopeptide ABC transporter substrate-binding protein [Paenalkalicoccus suaedae]|uniref:Oligopeptide ABC transporter substrate-binding protein n=1 Tax=Paenalkalicoccus suaedae TaxID=2592382 RepID=A0A859F985_9BACI|nr:oligopeptide ABC transporter substrate-binding protein [Paenalkalicoccus suaedae]QKS69609.1 oligopeptide ABC transporter substrate-binding protein [Paenalkalicoccus suaedae]
MKKSNYLLGASLISLSMLAVACGGNDDANTEPANEGGTNNTTENVDADADADANANANADGNEGNEGNNGDATGDAPQGGIVTYGYTSPFQGILDWAHYEGQDDALALGMFNGDGLYATGEDLLPEPHLATWEWSEDNLTVTFSLEQGVMWHNGEELTANDFLFAWETIAHPDYQGPRVTNVNIIEGFDEFHAGEADTISGVEITDEYTFSVTFKQASPNSLDALWAYPMPAAHFEGVEVADMIDSDQVRRNPVGLGPYQVTNIVPGEMIEYDAFADYWQGAPNLDGVVYRIIDGAQSAELLAQGEVDIIDLTGGQAVTLEGSEDVRVEQSDRLSYSYLGFKLGHWDGEKNVMDNPKFQSKELRQAMAHAIDRQGIIDAFSEGYGTVINAPQATVSWAYPDESALNQYEYDTERAMELLAEAGYEDVNGDGFVEDPDGNEFIVNVAAMDAPADIAEPRAQYMLQNFADAGINAQLMDGQLFDFNLFYDLVEEDDPGIDVYLGAWGLAADPDPTGLWLSTDLWNYPRWVNEESDELIARGLSEEAFDIDYRIGVYQEWNQLVNEELPMIPLNSPVNLFGISNDVGGVTPYFTNAQKDLHEWYIEQ